MESSIDRKERTVYVTGMHPNVTEEVIYDLFEKVGLVEKVVMHENDDGDPHHALVVFKHAESVMYSISVYNGYRLFDQCLSMRPLRESSHAAVFQRAGPSRSFPLRMAPQQNASPPPTPPTTPVTSHLNDNIANIKSTQIGVDESPSKDENQAPKDPRMTPQEIRYGRQCDYSPDSYQDYAQPNSPTFRYRPPRFGGYFGPANSTGGSWQSASFGAGGNAWPGFVGNHAVGPTADGNFRPRVPILGRGSRFRAAPSPYASNMFG